MGYPALATALAVSGPTGPALDLMKVRSAPLVVHTLVVLGSIAALACGAAGPGEAEWPPLAKKWFDRGDHSFRHGDIEDAEVAVNNALRIDANRPEIRLLAGRVALANLDYDRALQVLKGVEGSEARALRGRALWYAGRVDEAADELEQLVADPEVRDPWAAEIAKLARRGAGRKPFEISGGLLAVSDMPRVGNAALIVPLELSGEPALGLIATGTAEAVIDSSKGATSQWVSLRFGDRIDVRNVPALAKDLSGISRQVNAPIKILIGVNLLRHLHPTFDFLGGQFVLRTFEPPPPPHATAVKVAYVRGGGMLLRGEFGSQQSPTACSLLIDTSIPYPIALDDDGWKKAGVTPASLRSVPNSDSLRHGVLPMLRLGAFDMPEVPGLSGNQPVKEREDGLGIELDGVLGSGLLANFRVTLVDGGRTMWLEDIPRDALGPPALPTVAEPLPDEAYEEDGEEAEEPAGKGKPGAKPQPAKPGAAPKAPAAPAAPAAKPDAAPKSPAAAVAPAANGATPASKAPAPAAPKGAPGGAP